MKQEFNTAAHRETATTIRDAIMAKSVTAQMVGGTMLALVEASGEIIEALGNLGTERVTVKVNAYDGTQRVSVAGAKVYIDIFCNSGVPNFAVPRKEVEVDENGEVSFEVYKGFKYAVFSKLTGLSASFQLTYEACQDARTIELWHFPIGVFMLGRVGYYNEDTEQYRYVPYVTSGYSSDHSSAQEWDMQEGETTDEDYYDSILVATAETAFAIDQNTKADSTMPWVGNRYYGKLIPALPAYNDRTCEDWEAAQTAARADYNGNLNTAKILEFCRDAKAAEYCANVWAAYNRQLFLPSAGQLYLMYLNKAAINAIMTDANDEGGLEFDLLDNNWYWSSTQYDEWCAWLVNLGSGDTYYSNRRNLNYVRAVSAFHDYSS